MGALLAVSARGLALGKCLAEGAFHLPGVWSYSPALGFVPGPRDFFFVVWSVLSRWSLSDRPNTVIWESRGLYPQAKEGRGEGQNAAKIG